MERLTKTDEYEVWFATIERPFLFSSPFVGDFALMLVVIDSKITVEEREFISDEIVRQGCRYAVCTGHECSKWDDSIDFAFIATDPEFSPPDDRMVWTTWHENELLVDVAEYFRWNTTIANFVPCRFLALCLGGDTVAEGEVRSAIVKFFG